MIYAIGHDLQRIDQITHDAALMDGSSGFLTAAEAKRVAASSYPRVTFAGIFAAKEAAFKALPPLSGVTWPDLELAYNQHGKPQLILHGAIAAYCHQSGLTPHVSISHSGDYASAVVLLSADSGFASHFPLAENTSA